MKQQNHRRPLGVLNASAFSIRHRFSFYTACLSPLTKRWYTIAPACTQQKPATALLDVPPISGRLSRSSVNINQ